MGLPPYGPEPYASANSATPALVFASRPRSEARKDDTGLTTCAQGNFHSEAQNDRQVAPGCPRVETFYSVAIWSLASTTLKRFCLQNTTAHLFSRKTCRGSYPRPFRTYILGAFGASEELGALGAVGAAGASGIPGAFFGNGFSPFK